MRYMIADEDFGVFLGTHMSSLFGDKSRLYAIFAKTDMFGIYKATSFENTNDAQIYIDEFLSKGYDNLSIIPIDVDEKYICVSKIIKAGYEKYTHDMMDNMPMMSDSVH
jgi:hypothetical protein